MYYKLETADRHEWEWVQRTLRRMNYQHETANCNNVIDQRLSGAPLPILILDCEQPHCDLRLYDASTFQERVALHVLALVLTPKLRTGCSVRPVKYGLYAFVLECRQLLLIKQTFTPNRMLLRLQIAMYQVASVPGSGNKARAQEGSVRLIFRPHPQLPSSLHAAPCSQSMAVCCTSGEPHNALHSPTSSSRN